MALSKQELFSLSPREHRALVTQWENSRQLPLMLHASIQATLHNTAGKTYKDQFTAEMFMPGYKRQPQSLEEKMAIFGGLMQRKVKCPDCGEWVKAREAHACTGSAING